MSFAQPTETATVDTQTKLLQDFGEVIQDLKEAVDSLAVQVTPRKDTAEGSQKTIDKVVGISQLVGWVMSGSVAVLTLLFIVAIAFGFFEIKRWKKIREEAEGHLKVIRRLREKAEEEKEKLSAQIGTLSLTEEPSEETKKELNELASRLERVEAFGGSLSALDYNNRGVDLYNKCKYELATEAFEEATDLESNFVKAWFNMGMALGQLGRNEEALKAYEKAIKLKPDYAVAWSGKSWILRKLNRYIEALEAGEKAIKLKPDNAMAWSNKGAALAKLNRHNEALMSHDKAIELKQSLPKIWFNRACTYSLMNKKQEALSDLKEAIRIDGKYKEKAKTDEDLKSLWDDPEFKKLVE